MHAVKTLHTCWNLVQDFPSGFSAGILFKRGDHALQSLFSLIL